MTITTAAATAKQKQPATTERPILFSGEMVRAILDGRKGMTRRIVKPQPQEHHWSVLPGYEQHALLMPTPQGPMARIWHYYDGMEDGVRWIKCPFGKPGNRLWVRETWQVRDDKSYYTKADLKAHRTEHPNCAEIWEKTQPPEAFPDWRSPIFMPRWASRLTLEITAIRVERLQEITEADARAEGVPDGQRATAPDDKHANCVNCGQHRNQHVGQVRGCFGGTGTIFSTNTYRGGFAFLWDQINGKRASWESNPWVWIVEFKRVEVAK